MTVPSPDMALAAALFQQIHDATADPAGGVTRAPYDTGEREAHRIVAQAACALDLLVETDPAGNLYATLPGRDRSAGIVVFGSHLDSVRCGGDYDGVAGVVAGLAVIAGLRAAGRSLDHDVTVMAIRAEEGGAWFPAGYPGSRAALGLLAPEALETRRADTGITLAQAMRAEGFDPDWVRRGARHLRPDRIAAYVELHIEQGPVLDSEGLPIGLVTGIAGNRRHRQARVLGEWNHAGATPRRHRRDAAAALAELAFRLEQHWRRLEDDGHELVCTFCVMATAPEAGMGKVPGEARFQLDTRSVSQPALDLMFTELHRLVAEIAEARGVMFELGPETAGRPSATDPGLLDALQRAAVSIGAPHRRMPSGAGHDGIPTAMVFVRSQNGSHNPDEAMRLEDFDIACQVLTRWLTGDAYAMT
jgi:N-carbamoyl-L-amino-acid hydrolase